MESGSKRRGDAWRNDAAYGYLFNLDPIALAWEYVRRDPAYQDAWQHRREELERATAWSLQAFEDPALDARDAVPLWRPLPPATVCLTGCSAQRLDAASFSVWGLPVRLRLAHDGSCVRATLWNVHGSAHILLAPSLMVGECFAYELGAGRHAAQGWHSIQRLHALLSANTAHHRTQDRRVALTHVRSLQALDGAVAGCSQREIAAVLFGRTEVDERWGPDSGLRAQIRYLIRRGRAFMQGGRYRDLLYGAQENRCPNISQGDEPPCAESPCSL